MSCTQKSVATAAAKTQESTTFNATAPTIVYKTKGDYWQNVPVMLSEDKTQIISYPHPKDLIINGKLATPSPLPDGYWFDNRGISPNVAFTSWTYETYSRLETPPSVPDLFKAIIGPNPIAEMWDLGDRSLFALPVEMSIKKIMKQKDWTEKYRRLK